MSDESRKLAERACAHILSEWFNDNAPIGEWSVGEHPSSYRLAGEQCVRAVLASLEQGATTESIRKAALAHLA